MPCTTFPVLHLSVPEARHVNCLQYATDAIGDALGVFGIMHLQLTTHLQHSDRANPIPEI